ncbi:MAG TPA: metalloregulator ArsR/SmtB family transcription factor [Herpetosiphonaceae bacterium]|nr:metalloregulator ArsR/SmtB family transcription factor [Herpetosiphonaceae bacterium]
MSQEELQRLLLYLKAIANETRLKLLGLIADQERSVGELAELLHLKEPTISHHLTVLGELDLVRMRAEGNTHFYRLNGAALQELNKNLVTPERIAHLVQPDVDAADRKVLDTFLEGERFTKIPDQLRKRMVILKWLANQFEEQVTYSERQVNEIIQRHHPDSASLRRELIQFKFMQRDHGRYQRIPDAEREALWTELRGAKDALS